MGSTNSPGGSTRLSTQLHCGMVVQAGEAEAANGTLGLCWVGADHTGSQAVGRVQWLMGVTYAPHPPDSGLCA